MGKGSASSDDSWHHPSLLRDLTASPAAPQLRCALSRNLPAQQTRSIFLPAARCPLRRSPCERSHCRATAGTTSGTHTGASLATLSSFSRSGEQGQSSPRPSGSAPGASPAPAVSGPPTPGAIPPGAARNRDTLRAPWDRAPAPGRQVFTFKNTYTPSPDPEGRGENSASSLSRLPRKGDKNWAETSDRSAPLFKEKKRNKKKKRKKKNEKE